MKISANYLYYNNKATFNLFNKNISLKGADNKNSELPPEVISQDLYINPKGTALQSYLSDLFHEIKRLTSSHKHMTNNELAKLFKKYSEIDDKTIKDNIKKNSVKWKPEFVVNKRDEEEYFHKIKLRIEFLKEAAKIIPNLNENEYNLYDKHYEFMDYLFENVCKPIYERYSAENEEYEKAINNRLNYSEISQIKPINFDDELKKCSEDIQEKIKVQFNNDFEKTRLNYMRVYAINSSGSNYPVDFQNALLQYFPRYETVELNNTHFKYEPVYRWLFIDDIETFLKDFKVGQEYSYPRKQSCAKSKMGAEGEFCDNKSTYNVKFRIHPKNKITKAYDIKNYDYNKITNHKLSDDTHPIYRNEEVIYPANAKFKVLGIKGSFQHDEGRFPRMSTDGTYRILIDLQEV